MLYPLVMSPVFKQYLWGGEHLKQLYKKQIPGFPTAESWEVACHKNGASTVANGPYQGMPLPEVIETLGSRLLGDNIKKEEKFPLLLKVLDAQDKLSVQVHPEDSYAKAHENGELGKTEMWYVLSAQPGASLIYGFKEGVTKESFAQAIQQGTLEEILNFVPVSEGDVFYIPAGTVHGIGAGIIIAEMQQNSDTTYRVYDYNRKGADGKLRELHVEKALAVSNISCMTGKEKTAGLTVEDGENATTYLVCCPYFAFEKLEIAHEMVQNTNGNRMHILFVAQGSGKVSYQGGSVPFQPGQSMLIPAELGQYTIEGRSVVLKSYVPNAMEDIILPLRKKGVTDEQLSEIKGLIL